MTYRVQLTGETFKIKAALKADGWKWNADSNAWTCAYGEAVTAEEILNDVRWLKSVGCTRRDLRDAELSVTITTH